MSFRLYNRNRQQIIHKGQVSVGDKVSGTANWNYPDYEVTNINNNTGTIKHIMDHNTCDIKYVEGQGWGGEA